ncbi:MAG TPA: acyl-CoA synthetase FdrA [Thermoanaerobaculia bacterium]|nr:acyl-CoA synthetase FdrA [Thermoanaerobaculia bacterium]
MSVVRWQLRPGLYADSIVLLRIQKGIAERPGVEDAGVVMGTVANLTLLAAQGLAPEGLAEAASDDLVVVVRAQSEPAATAALAALDELLGERRGGGGEEEDYRPRSLAAAVGTLPSARWVLVSVPGRHAARVARQALEWGRHVFLFSDNVSLAEEVALKREAAARGLLVAGPDCGTAIVAGTGLGFANRVRRGEVGVVAASGTGLQAVASRLHALGAGISHALGTGGRDLAEEVGGITTLQALDLLARDEGTRVIVLIAKPPAPAVAARVLAAARATAKPTVVAFLGYAPPARRLGSLHFALNLSEAADLALEALGAPSPSSASASPEVPATSGPGHLRALFAGGTLAYEAILGLAPWLGTVASNLHSEASRPLADLGRSEGHTVLDLGEDAFTVGRPHPAMDSTLRLARFRQEAADPETGLILLDFVLGDAAQADPAAEWAPAIAQARAERPGLEVVALVIGTEEDPQDAAAQAAALEGAGARVFTDSAAAVAWVGERLAPPWQPPFPPAGAEALAAPLAAVNVGLELFAASLVDQGAQALHVDWRPPAGGNERLLAILDRLRR